jgi:predicted SprT family Zn-dependent metalloprotease
METKDFEFWKPHLLSSQVKAWNTLEGSFGKGVGKLPAGKWNTRLRSTAGRAIIEKGYIELSSKLFQVYPEGFIIDIIPHELAHIAAYRVFQDDGHGKGWHSMMDALGITRKDRRCWTHANMLECRQMFWKTNS